MRYCPNCTPLSFEWQEGDEPVYCDECDDIDLEDYEDERRRKIAERNEY